MRELEKLVVMLLPFHSHQPNIKFYFPFLSIRHTETKQTDKKKSSIPSQICNWAREDLHNSAQKALVMPIFQCTV